MFVSEHITFQISRAALEPIIHSNCAYRYISSLRNHWISAFSGRISLNTN